MRRKKKNRNYEEIINERIEEIKKNSLEEKEEEEKLIEVYFDFVYELCKKLDNSYVSSVMAAESKLEKEKKLSQNFHQLSSCVSKLIEAEGNSKSKKKDEPKHEEIILLNNISQLQKKLAKSNRVL